MVIEYQTGEWGRLSEDACDLKTCKKLIAAPLQEE